jgi:hypothetical protein
MRLITTPFALAIVLVAVESGAQTARGQSPAGTQPLRGFAAPTPANAQVPISAAARKRAAELFGEVRQAITRFGAAPDVLPANFSADAAQAAMLTDLARHQATAFPDAAADAADQAFQLVRRIPGGDDLIFDQARRDPALMPIAIGRSLKMQLEPELIRLLVQLKRGPRALGLARQADIDHADLYNLIIVSAPPDQILALAAECRAADGTYPYAALGSAALSTTDPERRRILEAGYAALASETTFKYRSLALMFARQTATSVPAELAAGALQRLLQGMVERPTRQPGGQSTDAEQFGPSLLELMSTLDPQRSARIAADHPDWDAARKTPGRTPGNPIGRPPGSPVIRPPVQSNVITRPPQPAAAPPPALPPDVQAISTLAEFDRAVEAARALSPLSARISKLTSLASLLARKPLN